MQHKQENDSIYRDIVGNMPYGFSYNRIIRDQQGNPLDFEFIDMNIAFQQLTGIKREQAIGKRTSEAVPFYKKTESDWIGHVYKAAVSGKSSLSIYYSEYLNKWLSICTYNLHKEHFVVIMKDATAHILKYDRLRKILDSTPDFIVVADLHGNIVDCNNKVLEIFGKSAKNEIIGSSALELIAPECREKAFADMVRVISKNSLSSNIYTYLDKNGNAFPGEMSVSLVYDNWNRPANVIGIAKDITERIKSQEALIASEEKLRSIFSSSPDSIMVTDIHGIVLDCNPEALNLLEFVSKETLLGRCLYDFINADSLSLLEERNRILLEKGVVKNVEYNLTTSKGKQITIEASFSLIYTSDGAIDSVVMISKDITSRKKAESEIRYLSFHDRLTGLHNRTFFENELHRLDNENQLPLSLIIGDVNSLKLTNEIFGHNAGDRLLQSLADIFRQACRKDDFIARWGGDEFAVILPQTSHETASVICSRINKLCGNTDMEPVRPSISLGCAAKEKPGQDIRQILQEAENRMYKNKLLDNRSIRSSLIASLEKTLFEKSYETNEHAQRMRQLSVRLGRALGLTDTEIGELSLLAILHDIGKIAVPDNILMKPGKLTSEEWEEMKKHPEIGYRIAESSQELAQVAEYILSHHEHWNGAGYPNGLAGKEIPKLSRILSVVDAYDVMTHARPYKEPASHEEAMKEIKRCSGKQFDPEIARVFVAIMDESKN